jgi:hypothetical protein
MWIESPFSHGSGSHCAWPANASSGEMKKNPARVAAAETSWSSWAAFALK